MICLYICVIPHVKLYMHVHVSLFVFKRNLSLFEWLSMRSWPGFMRWAGTATLMMATRALQALKIDGE